MAMLIINTSALGIDFAFKMQNSDVKTKHIETEKQSLSLPAETEKFLADNGITFRNLTAIGVVVGPGSFTGIRLGIAYAKGLSIGLNIPVVSVNAFEIYLEKSPDAFVAIDSNRGDFFCASADLAPCVMTIDKVEKEQMKCPRTVGHNPYDMRDAAAVAERKLARRRPGEDGQAADATDPVIPMYLRPHYAEQNAE
ncbi:MAG: tRNA (adenosine(37)-N6)-threonylcarbamoyltransferase complex dimerization subunit type 1 TsaB [Rickettsiales bacterium]|jgi:tRNA threonylcarbamoyladenosine biosynthesis protein TsaB|nr:tRNA (adenosine(37)-N6)-threonylcarbamoyltransferase complex dimerization subunit type 1 TsaB [Rickettsiales bacterium]